MKIDVFEGFKRLNYLIVFLIIVIGSFLSWEGVSNNIFDVIGPGETCWSEDKKTYFLDNGSVSLAFCFPPDTNINDRVATIENFEIPSSKLDEYNKKLLKENVIDMSERLLIVVLIAVGYYLFCAAIKYIALGFIKKE